MVAELPEKYIFHFDPLTIEHLGTKLYSRIAPAIAESVSNSWDADATKVLITFSEGKPEEVHVRDFGSRGMNPDEVQQNYLHIGRNCREEMGREKTKGGRYIMGRKGIGKLSGFGVANKVEVRTIQKGFATCIELDYEKMKTWIGGDYEPTIIKSRCGKTNDKDGTEIILKDLHRKSPIKTDSVKKELAKKFSIVTDKNFKVYVNGSLITEKDRMLRKQCRLSWNVKDLPDGNIISKTNNWKVSGWMGFVGTASQVDRGIDIFVRGKAAEANSLFNMKSASNIIVVAYLVGEIHANFLDDEKGDFVSTGRDKVQWESIQGEFLELWGQKTITKLLEEYVKIQRKEKEKKLIKEAGFDKWLKTRSPREQRIAQKLVKTIVNDDKIQSDSAGPLLEMIKTNIEFDAFQDLVEEIEETGTNAELLMKLVGEWRIIEARKHLMLSDGRLEIISKLDYFVQKGALEVQQIQPIFEENGWLVNPSWGKVSGQNTYTKLLRKHCIEPKKLDDVDRRIDIVGYDAGGTINIVELKRPEKTLSLSDLNQIEKYRNWAKVNLLSGSGPDSPTGITSLLIVGKLSNQGEIKEKVDTLAGINVRVETYHDLLNRAKRVYGIMEKDLEKIAPEYARTKKIKKTTKKKTTKKK